MQIWINVDQHNNQKFEKFTNCLLNNNEDYEVHLRSVNPNANVTLTLTPQSPNPNPLIQICTCIAYCNF